MIDLQAAKSILGRDGTGQKQRLQEALNPSYIPVDEQNIGDHLRKLKDLATLIYFYDEQNNQSGTWETFFKYGKNGDPEFEEEVARFAANPKDPDIDLQKKEFYSRPHFVLLITFLKLLDYLKTQINETTERHLDHHFREVLGVSPKAPLPDMVQAIIQLQTKQENFLIPQGSLFTAGKDSSGVPIQYKAIEDTIINQASVSKLKCVFFDAEHFDISTWYETHQNLGDNELVLSMLSFALENDGNQIPPYNSEDNSLNTTLLDNLHKDLNKAESVKNHAIDFIEHNLWMNQYEFLSLYTLKSTKNKEQIFQVLINSYQQQWIENRKNKFRSVYDQNTPGNNTLQLCMQAMLMEALGDPLHGDPLPPFQGNKADVLKRLIIAFSASDNSRNEALLYIQNELFLKEKDFNNLQSLYNLYPWEPANLQQGNKLLNDIEWASRQKFKLEKPIPYRSDQRGFYKREISQKEIEDVNIQFNAFGDSSQKIINAQENLGLLGLCISSPLLLLQEGKRSITLSIEFDEISENLPAFIDLINQQTDKNENIPIICKVSTIKGWMQLRPTVKISTLILGNPYKIVDAEQNNNSYSGNDFSVGDVNNYLVDAGGNIFYINSFSTVGETNVVNGTYLPGSGEKSFQSRIYHAESVFINGLQIQLKLDVDFPSLSASANLQIPYVPSSNPSLFIQMNQFVVEDKEHGNYFDNYYELLSKLIVKNLYLSVTADGLKPSSLANDQSTLNGKKPFDVFGTLPESGNSFYFAHPEVCSKPLSKLSLQYTWLNAPDDFKIHYQEYAEVNSNSTDANKYSKDNLYIKDNNAFTAKLIVHNEYDSSVLVDKMSLFGQDINGIIVPVNSWLPEESQINFLEMPGGSSDVLQWKRYFKLELNSPDFMHKKYPELLNKKMQSSDALVRALYLKPPYTPKMKDLTLGYEAGVMLEKTGQNLIVLYNINPYGFEIIQAGSSINFMPEYEYEAELYIGLSCPDKPSSLSLLVKIAEGSANPDIKVPDVNWYYRSEDEWQSLQGNITRDGTNGLLHSGVVRMNLPEDLSSRHQLLDDGLYWLRIIVTGNKEGLPAWLSIITQAIELEFKDQQNNPSHFEKPLPPGSIKKPVDSRLPVKKVLQPFSSGKGKPAEEDGHYYLRVSERLRHKQRALTMWDYERLVLEKFPEIYKAKCIPAGVPGYTNEPGTVTLVLVPDINGMTPFDPYEPKVSPGTIKDVYQFLKPLMPSFTDLRVMNPTYLSVKVRVQVSIEDGLDEIYYQQKLNDELKQFMAPWAFDKGAEIVIGSKVHAGTLVNFIAERPYVAYVAGLKIYEGTKDHSYESGLRYDQVDQVVLSDRPDAILVSAKDHVVDIVRVFDAEGKTKKGINFMRIEFDFEIF